MAIDRVRIKVAPGYIDGPAARDVAIAAVLTCVDAQRWVGQALGDGELDDGRTVAQVVVGQAEFADVLVLTEPEPTTLAVLRRLALNIARAEPDPKVSLRGKLKRAGWDERFMFDMLANMR